MRHHTVVGGGGTRLHVVEAGAPRGPSILFLHGFSLRALVWGRQLGGDLARRYRLVAMDLRGHGASEVPRDGYDDSRRWADDVDAVIRTLELDRPVLCGWSYGPLVILDYVRHHGEARVGGIHFVSGISQLGSESALSVLTPAFLGLVPGFFSTDVTEAVGSLSALLRLCVARELEAADQCTLLGCAASVPPFVRQALFSRAVDNDAVLRSLSSPLLITHGAADAVVTLDVVERHRALVPHAQVHVMPGVGHAPFFEDAAAFDRRLAEFRDEVSSAALAARC